MLPSFCINTLVNFNSEIQDNIVEENESNASDESLFTEWTEENSTILQTNELHISRVSQQKIQSSSSKEDDVESKCLAVFIPSSISAKLINKDKLISSKNISSHQQISIEEDTAEKLIHPSLETLQIHIILQSPRHENTNSSSNINATDKNQAEESEHIDIAIFKTKSSKGKPTIRISSDEELLQSIINEMNGKGMSSVPHAVIQSFTVSKIKVYNYKNKKHRQQYTDFLKSSRNEIPGCPVCMFRIEPLKIGLKSPDLCQICGPNNPSCNTPTIRAENSLSSSSSDLSVAAAATPSSTSRFCSPTNSSCRNMTFLMPWIISQSECLACYLIHQHRNGSVLTPLPYDTYSESLYARQDDHQQDESLLSQQQIPHGSLDNRDTKRTESSTDEHKSIQSTLSPSTPTPTRQRSNLVISRISCYKCGMRETLWVCLICGTIGCGRYSQKHAGEHYRETGHSLFLELVTQRIWDYESDSFVHRADLLKCPMFTVGGSNFDDSVAHAAATLTASASFTSPSTPFGIHSGSPTKRDASFLEDSPYYFQHYGIEQQQQQHHQARATFMPAVPDFETSKEKSKGISQQTSCCSTISGYYDTNNCSTSSFDHEYGPPKKAIMIGKEYEALLQIALEEQAQHYEAQISCLLTELTEEDFGEDIEQWNEASEQEKMQIQSYRAQIEKLHLEIEKNTKECIKIQKEEAIHRSTGQKLLREQADTKDLLDKLTQEAKKEYQDGKTQVVNLEEQIEDLTANLKMMQRISKMQELDNAQIFGTTGVKPIKKHRGKKGRRSRRR